MGTLGRFGSADALCYPRGERVIVRTVRGLEIGEVLLSPEEESADSRDGTIVRAMTSEDELLEQRLLKHRHEAYEHCACRVAELGLPVMLMDVEHLFDGSTLLFYFLGEETPEVQNLMKELAEEYDTRVQFDKFAETLNEGCGPGCGTEEAENGCGSCDSGCPIASACGRP